VSRYKDNFTKLWNVPLRLLIRLYSYHHHSDLSSNISFQRTSLCLLALCTCLIHLANLHSNGAHAKLRKPYFYYTSSMPQSLLLWNTASWGFINKMRQLLPMFTSFWIPSTCNIQSHTRACARARTYTHTHTHTLAICSVFSRQRNREFMRYGSARLDNRMPYILMLSSILLPKLPSIWIVSHKWVIKPLLQSSRSEMNMKI
jgi:hypothetical protein